MYDGDGNLVKKVKPDGSKTIYVGGVYEVDKSSGGTDAIRTVTYYPVAGAMRIDSTLYYVLKDHLGSASVVTDSSGNIVGEQRYYPFGETRLSTGTMVTDKLFTGQRAMEDLGIYHYGARFYSPGLGRFLSADSIVPGYADPQNLNRCSYHARIQDVPQQDTFKLSVANKYVPKPKKKGSGGGRPFQAQFPLKSKYRRDVECPDWNVCMGDASTGAMQGYWDSNDSFTYTLDLDALSLIGSGGGLLTSGIGYYVFQFATWSTVALFFGISVLEPTFIGEVIFFSGLAVAAVSVAVGVYAYDVDNINDAIVANVDGAVITSASGNTETVDTILPFSAPLNLLLWGVNDPEIVAVQPP